MTEEQKRFKILKRESYEEQISEESKRATIKTFIMGLSSAAALVTFLAASKSPDLTTKLADTGLGLLNAGYGVYHLKGLMEAISRKTMLQGKIEDINTELEMPENEESRGMRRWQLTLKIL